MRAHILQHTINTTPGSTLEWLKRQNIPCTFTNFFKPNPVLPDLSTFDFLIICGGEMNVDEEKKYPWLKAEKDFIKKALDKNKKIVGLCLGGQLMAEVLGARVGPHKSWEVGWQQVELKPLPSFNLPLTPALMAFQYHGYSFDTPPGAFQFARSEACEHQGFLWKTRALALQFHPESTKEWVLECAKETLPTGRYVQTASQMIEGNKNQTQLQTWYFNLLTALMMVE